MLHLILLWARFINTTMTNLIFFTVIASIMLNFSFGVMNYSGINRTFELAVKGPLEASCLTLDNSANEVMPYFYREFLEQNVELYFAENLPRYTRDYTTAYYYFNDADDHSYCTSKYCRGVKISLRAKINSFFEYKNAKEFYVKKV